jgi:hypothetical protein
MRARPGDTFAGRCGEEAEMTRTWRALAWGGASAAILLGGLAALGHGLVTLRVSSGEGGAPGNVQSAALQAVVETVAREALLPHAALTLASWLALAWFAPRVDASRRALALSLPACALLVFPIVGAGTFHAWSPRGAGDVLGTAALLSGAVALALWLGRLVPGLGPGSFGASRR